MSRFLVALLATSLVGVAYADDPRDPSEYGATRTTEQGARTTPTDTADKDVVRIHFDDARDKEQIRTSLEDVKGIEINEKQDTIEVNLGGDPNLRNEVKSALEDIEGATVRDDKGVLDVSIEAPAMSGAPAAVGPSATETDRLRIRYDNADEKSMIEKALDDLEGVEATDRGGYLEIDTSTDPNVEQRVRDALNEIGNTEVDDRAGFVEFTIGPKGATLNGADTARGRDVKQVSDERDFGAETKDVDDDVDVSLEGAHEKPGIKIGETEEAGVKGDVSVDMIGAESGDIRYENGKYILTNTYEKGQVKVTHTETAVRSASKDVKWGSRDIREDLTNAANDIIDAVDEAGEDVGREIDETFETEEELEREEMKMK